ncbi:MAG: polysaccharide biosynthesis protein [Betaproteobacteria bacterium]|nr:polysaccharide biosynthesis protein [Betaproteobacteria bacterium]
MNRINLNSRILLVILHDVVATLVAWLGAYWLRFNLALPPGYLADALSTLAWVMPLQAAVFWYFGLYRGIWRFASLPDLRRILLAVLVAAVLTPTVLILFRVETVVPRSVLLLDPILLVAIMSGSRVAYRAWREHGLSLLLAGDARPVLVAGAGAAADLLLRELVHHPGRWRVAGLFDDDPAMHGRHVQGVSVLGRLGDIPAQAQRLQVKEVVLALPSASLAQRRQLTEVCSALGLNVLTMPSTEDLMAGRVAVSQLRRIELDDLLGRESVKLDDRGLVDLIGGRTVLVTGAGGSIGAELCRQIARFGPARLVFFEASELALYEMEQEFKRRHPEQPITCIVGDVKDAARVDEVMVKLRPALVFHAAAYKHVPLMEQDNAMQALRNNVLGTSVLANAAVAHGVEHFVLISTDKAVNPTNVMGASKRLAEKVCQAMQGRNGTRFVSVRFGNVLGSSGSVIPKFQQQIAEGGPVTVTHPEITRYFMSIPEAAQLVLQAGLMGRGGEVFVLDMGEPVKIADLARLMIHLSGHQDGDIAITYTGLRPGEKLYEELLADEESTLPTPHPKLRIAKARDLEGAEVSPVLDWIANTASAGDEEVRTQLARWLPEYKPAIH